MIYICSPYAGNTKDNTAFVGQARGHVTNQGAVPLTPHLLYPQILNGSILEERETGIHLESEILRRHEEIWVCGDRVSTGMRRKVAYAKDGGIPVCWISVYEIVENQTA